MKLKIDLTQRKNHKFYIVYIKMFDQLAYRERLKLNTLSFVYLVFLFVFYTNTLRLQSINKSQVYFVLYPMLLAAIRLFFSVSP